MKESKIIQIIYLIGIALICLASCAKESIEPKGDQIEQSPTEGRWGFNGNIIYYENSHLTNYTAGMSLMNNWDAIITFTPSCVYDLNDPENQIDWNKLFGCKKSIFPWDNQKNGAYLVWSWDIDDQVIRVSWYLHDRDGDHIHLNQNGGIAVSISEPITVGISNYKDHFTFHIGNQVIVKYKNTNNIDNFKNASRLNPYFGGNLEAPHQMIVNVLEN